MLCYDCAPDIATRNWRLANPEKVRQQWGRKWERTKKALQLMRASPQPNQAKARHRGRQKGELQKITLARITMAAFLRSQKVSKRSIASQLYPLHADKDQVLTTANNTIFRSYEERIRQEQQRLASLPDAGLAEFSAAKARIPHRLDRVV